MCSPIGKSSGNPIKHCTCYQPISTKHASINYFSVVYILHNRTLLHLQILASISYIPISLSSSPPSIHSFWFSLFLYFSRCTNDFFVNYLFVCFHRGSIRYGDLDAAERRAFGVRVRRWLAVDILRVRRHRNPVVRGVPVARSRGPRIPSHHTAR